MASRPGRSQTRAPPPSLIVIAERRVWRSIKISERVHDGLTLTLTACSYTPPRTADAIDALPIDTDPGVLQSLTYLPTRNPASLTQHIKANFR